jgi:hypothetical protein
VSVTSPWQRWRKLLGAKEPIPKRKKLLNEALQNYFIRA